MEVDGHSNKPLHLTNIFPLHPAGIIAFPFAAVFNLMRCDLIVLCRLFHGGKGLTILDAATALLCISISTITASAALQKSISIGLPGPATIPASYGDPGASNLEPPDNFEIGVFPGYISDIFIIRHSSFIFTIGTSNATSLIDVPVWHFRPRVTALATSETHRGFKVLEWFQGHYVRVIS